MNFRALVGTTLYLHTQRHCHRFAHFRLWLVCFWTLPAHFFFNASYTLYSPVAVYDGSGIVAFVNWLRLKQYFKSLWRLSPIYGCGSLVAIWGMGMLSSCICSTLVSVCEIKGILVGPLAQWGKDLTYYIIPFFCLVNWDINYTGSACRETDLPPGRILYKHTYTLYSRKIFYSL